MDQRTNSRSVASDVTRREGPPSRERAHPTTDNDDLQALAGGRLTGTAYHPVTRSSPGWGASRISHNNATLRCASSVVMARFLC